MIKRIFNKLGTLLRIFPCPGCGAVSANGHNLFCPKCRDDLSLFKTDGNCPGCGGVNDGVLALCGKCLRMGMGRPWGSAISLFPFSALGRKMILKYKHGDITLARSLAALAAERMHDEKEHFDVIVPLALHPLRQLKRSFNQSAIFARLLAEKLDVEYVDALRRNKLGKRQSALKRKERLKNMYDAFNVKPGKRESLRGKNVLLVDDIFTTGATLTAAAKALEEADISSLCVFTIGRS